MNCPFCGLLADVPHETQEECIQALQAEIDRTRDILERVHPGRYPRRAREKQEEQAPRPGRPPEDPDPVDLAEREWSG